MVIQVVVLLLLLSCPRLPRAPTRRRLLLPHGDLDFLLRLLSHLQLGAATQLPLLHHPVPLIQE
jgi:hypothetical protein